MLVGYRRAAHLLEVKNPESAHAKRKAKNISGATAARQQEWRERWRGPPVVTVRTAEEALMAIGAVRPAEPECSGDGLV